MGVNDLEQVLPDPAESATSSPSPAADAGASTPEDGVRIPVPAEPSPDADFILTDAHGEPPPKAAEKTAASPGEGAQDADASAAPDDQRDQAPVPYERFAKVYGRMKALERQVSTAPPPGTTPAAQEDPQPGTGYSPATDPTLPINPRPEEDSFDSFDKYVEALAEWKYKESARAEQAQRKRQEAEQRFHERLTAGAARMPDFETKAYIPAALGDIVIHSEMAADLAYYWGENDVQRAEALALLDLPPIEQAYRIAQLEVALRAKSPQRKQTTKTEFPNMQHVEGVRDGASKAVSDMSPAEYIAHMNAKEGIPFHD
jgi:hypothetical protein